MQWPYSFQNSRKDFFGVVPTAGASSCSTFAKALITLPYMLFQFFRYMIDEKANLSATFLSMIYTPGEVKMSFVKLSAVQKGVWVPCDGSIYSKTQYPDLYAAIGDTFSVLTNPNYLDSNNVPIPPAAVPAGYFRTPDLRGIGLVGAPAILPQGTQVGLATVFGEAQHQLIPGEDVPHYHFLAVPDIATLTPGGGILLNGSNYLCAALVYGNYGNYYLAGSDNLDGKAPPATDYNQPTVGRTSTQGGLQGIAQNAPNAINYGTGTVNNYAASKPHNNMQPSMGCYFYMFAGVPVTTNTTSSDPTLQPI